MVIIARFTDYSSLVDALELERVGAEELIFRSDFLFSNGKSRAYAAIKNRADELGAHIALVYGQYIDGPKTYSARVNFYRSPIFLD